MNSRKSLYRALGLATIGFLIIAIASLVFHAKASQYGCQNGAGYLGKATKMSEDRTPHGGVWLPGRAITCLPERPIVRMLPLAVKHPEPRPVIVLAFRFRPPPQFL